MKIGQIKIEYLHDSSYKNLVFFEDVDFDDVHYDDVTSILVWSKEGVEEFDYFYTWDRIKELCESTGFSNLDDEEKEIVCDFYATSAQTITTYFVVDCGMSPEEATEEFSNRWKIHFDNLVESCSLRWGKFVQRVALLMSMESMESLNALIVNPMIMYNYSAILGKGFGDATPTGIMNFMNSNEGFVGSGFVEQDYVLNTGYVDQDVIDVAYDTLRLGF